MQLNSKLWLFEGRLDHLVFCGFILHVQILYPWTNIVKRVASVSDRDVRILATLRYAK